MPTSTEILKELQTLGNETTKRIFQNHGAPEPIFGVKVGDLKKIVQRVKKDHVLAIDLYKTGNSDAMYLAGLLADEKKVTKRELQDWAEQASWFMLSEYTVAGLAADSPYGWELGLDWIESDRESVATAGWSTLSNWVLVRPDNELDLSALRALLDRVAATLQTAPNRVRYTMNGFVIACGAAVESLHDQAVAVAKKIGTVRVDAGNTACKVPDAISYIQKTVDSGYLGKKKKMARC